MPAALNYEETARLNDVARGSNRETAALLMAILSGQYAGRINFEDVAGTSYTLEAEDLGKFLNTTSASDVSMTVPPGMPEGWYVFVSQGGAGQVQFVAGSGVTIQEPDNQYKSEKRYVMLQLIRMDKTTYRLVGRTVAV